MDFSLPKSSKGWANRWIFAILLLVIVSLAEAKKYEKKKYGSEQKYKPDGNKNGKGYEHAKSKGHGHKHGKSYAYDYIVVGAGSAGCIVASRLSEYGSSVLLIEAGGHPAENMSVPAIEPTFWTNPDYTVLYPLVAQKYASLSNGGQISLITGQMLGGTGSVNDVFFNRGSPYDFDNWAKITYDSSWKYKNIEKYFKKMETYQGDFPSSEHGYHGPLVVSRPKYTPGLETWLAAGRALGYPYKDPNAYQVPSVSPIEFAKKKGHCHSSYEAYIKPHAGYRKNLKLLINTEAYQIVFKGYQAVGVKYVTNKTGDAYEGFAYARKEIIISAGVVGSPVLLLRSGIGPKNYLKYKKGYHVKELPVGENFQDHVVLVLDFILNSYAHVHDPDQLTHENWKLFKEYGTGPYTTSNGFIGQLFASVGTAKKEYYGKWPNVQLVLLSNKDQPFSINGNASLEDYEVPVSCVIFLGRPNIRGTLKLNTSNYNANDYHYDSKPILDIQHLSHHDDMYNLMEGVRLALRLFEYTYPYSKVGAYYSPNPLPACKYHKFKSDKYFECYIKQAAIAGLNPTGTVRMGSDYDYKAVVNSKLKVKGIYGLRVIDGSIMPDIVNTNPLAAVYVIAEKGAADILYAWDGKYY